MRIPTGRPNAVACIRGGETASNLSGTVKFYSVPGGTLVAAEITGLPENDTGFHALHIHEGGNCTGKDFADTGGHFNPGGREHPEHAGDLPPLLSRKGRANMLVVTDRFQICDVIGRTVVIHAEADDFRTQPAGNAGTKIGCGVIRPY